MTTTEPHIHPCTPPPVSPSARPRWPRRVALGCALLFAAVGVAGVIGCGGELADRIDGEERDSQRDARVSDCGIDAGSHALTAAVALTNHSSGTSTYVVEVAFEDRAGNVIDHDEAVVSELASGASTHAKAVGDESDRADVTCRVEHVERFADD